MSHIIIRYLQPPFKWRVYRVYDGYDVHNPHKVQIGRFETKAEALLKAERLRGIEVNRL